MEKNINYKKIICYIVVIIIFLFDIQICSSQFAEWKLVNIKKEPYSIKFLSPTKAWLFLGDIAYKSSDGGNSWGLPILMNPSIGFGGSTYFVYSDQICFADSLNGWAVKGDANIYRTFNSGNSWDLVPTGIQSVGLYSVYFVNSSTGWAAGGSLIGNKGVVYKTTNKGTNWVMQTNTVPGSPVASLKFLNSQTGFCSTYENDTVTMTTDGGLTWINQDLGTGQRTTKIFFANSSTGWVLGNPYHLSKTTNGGQNWNNTLSFPDNTVNLFFLNPTTGWMTSVRQVIRKTTNGGENWFNQLSLGGSLSNVFRDIYFKNEATGWALNNNGNILKTTNGGTSWTNEMESLLESGNIKKSIFLNVNNGYCFSIINNTSKLWKTTNKGYNWKQVGATFNYILNDLEFISEEKAYVCGNNRIIYTSNHGETWNAVFENNTNFTSIDFLNEQTGWACGYDGKIIKTTNAGLNWAVLNSGLIYNLNNICFTMPNEGYIAADSGYILKTTDGGQNWNSSRPHSNYILSYKKLYFINSQTGYAMGGRAYISGFPPGAGSRNRILKTTNSGVTWDSIFTQAYTGVVKTFNDINFINAQTGYCVADIYYDGKNAGEIMVTFNGGNNWSTMFPTYPSALRSITFIDKETGWIVGDNATVLTTASPVGISSISDVVPDKFVLYQNYPNPFNPATKIKFDIPKSSMIELKVYDITGRELTTLVNQYLNAGSFDYEWSAAQFSSGIYFYKLTTEDFSVTRKMVLVK